MTQPFRSAPVGAGVIYTLAIFASAALVFSIQPIVAKLVLPRLGGAPAVWTTAMLFFQAVLLAGYVYAHLLSRIPRLRHQAMVQAAVLLAGAAFLPIALPDGWRLAPEGAVGFQALGLFAAMVAVPFLALSANAPLLQHWFAATGRGDAADPYFLYAASNVGSIAALLAYPLVLEPSLGAGAISLIWAAGYGIFAALMFACAWMVRDRSGPPRAARVPGSAIRWLGWVGLAAVPSSMMLSTTQVIATDLGSFPLLWVIPLSLYLLTFVLAFSRTVRLPRPVVDVLFVVSLIPAIVVVAQDSLSGLGWIGFGLMLFGFLATALIFHTRLYDSRPDAGGLTSFYLALSVGGVLGGIFNALIAPAVFDALLEVPVVLALAGLGLTGRWRWGDVGLAVPAAGLVGAVWIVAPGTLADKAALATVAAVAMLALLVFRTRPLGFVVLATALLVIGHLTAGTGVVHQARSFFGIYTVKDRSDGIRSLSHGTTVHGLQFRQDLGQRPRVLSYYHPGGPMAEIVRAAPDGARIGIVGLGVGALTCYAKPSQDWTLYEIDPLVDQIARDPVLFDYMDQCGAGMPTIYGDARISLEDRGGPYDVLLIDAFSSDSVPLHLLTVEAVDLYRSRLSDRGVLVFHISNRFFDLAPVLGRAAAASGVGAWVKEQGGPLAPGTSASVVVLMGPSAPPGWQPLGNDGALPWTDDFASLLSALRR